MKKNVAIVAGGDSSEVIVSLKSAAGLYSYIDKSRYNLYIITIRGHQWQLEMDGYEKVAVDKNDFSIQLNGTRICFDFAYITIHGTPGENGILQGYFDLIGLRYSSCGVLASAITFNKFTCNNYLKGFGIKVSDSVLLRKGQHISAEEVEKAVGFPCFVKPNVGGSSFGVTKVKEAGAVEAAVEKAFSEGEEVMIEAFMKGTELTCGMYKIPGKTVVFPVTEVVPHNEFFDFDAKYKGQVEEITPARISDSLTRRVQQLTAAIYDILGCKGIIRVDYIVTEGEVIQLLEVNTTPGMTETSFIPQQIAAAGLAIAEVMNDIIEN
ncbi:MAG: D-alanine--D-alanine ligase A [Paludibacter sp. 47-17]|nr:MAG: D-alanine--D-alanine ligase [Paludibacter sp.]OJX91373.1 MAG: D-alanine--D-alanine ligase A [Paludibacter sp. 47-17]